MASGTGRVLRLGLITALLALPAAGGDSCPDTLLPGTSLFVGSTVAASTNVSDQAACCALCHGAYKDECLAWEWIDVKVVHTNHNCDIFAKVGPPAPAPGRVSARTARAPPAPAPPGPAPPQVGLPCHSDSDCQAQWGGREWRCLERRAVPSALNGCHMHATTTNSTCACQPSACSGGAVQAVPGATAAPNATTRLFVIGDSISEGMRGDLESLLAVEGWSLQHNPGNGDNSNYGAHCVQDWLPAESSAYDIISFNFGLHGTRRALFLALF
jgi:hypothetical protein